MHHCAMKLSLQNLYCLLLVNWVIKLSCLKTIQPTSAAADAFGTEANSQNQLAQQGW